MNKPDIHQADLFIKEAPEVAKAFFGLLESLESIKTITPKMQQLIFIAAKAAQGDNEAVYAHVPMAKKLGASRDEIKDVIVLTITICGVQAIFNCLPHALEIYDNV